MDPRVVKPHTPVSLVIGAVSIALLVGAFILYAVWSSGRGIHEARMTGVVVGKEFISEPEQQIIFGREGSLKARQKEGKFIIKVEVPQNDGTKKLYDVDVQTREPYEKIQVGDSMDVGPYLIPQKK